MTTTTNVTKEKKEQENLPHYPRSSFQTRKRRALRCNERKYLILLCGIHSFLHKIYFLSFFHTMIPQPVSPTTTMTFNMPEQLESSRMLASMYPPSLSASYHAIEDPRLLGSSPTPTVGTTLEIIRERMLSDDSNEEDNYNDYQRQQQQCCYHQDEDQHHYYQRQQQQDQEQQPQQQDCTTTSPSFIAHTDYWHSTQTMKRSETFEAGLHTLADDVVSMEEQPEDNTTMRSCYDEGNSDDDDDDDDSDWSSLCSYNEDDESDSDCYSIEQDEDDDDDDEDDEAFMMMLVENDEQQEEHQDNKTADTCGQQQHHEQEQQQQQHQHDLHNGWGIVHYESY